MRRTAMQGVLLLVLALAWTAGYTSYNWSRVFQGVNSDTARTRDGHVSSNSPTGQYDNSSAAAP